MDRKKKFYSDILSAIDLIDRFILDLGTLKDYKKDLKTKSAVERQLGIIGEALKRIKDVNPNESIAYHSNIIGFRNRLVHSYDSIDDEMVWTIIKRHLDPLKKEISAKLID